MSVIEGSINGEVLYSASSPSIQEGIPGGFLLFDRQVQHHKDWLNFRQSPEIQALEEHTRTVLVQLAELPRQVGKNDQELLAQSLQLRIDLDQAITYAKHAKTVYENPKSLRAKLYKITRSIAPSLAEHVIPYETTQSKLKTIKDQRKAIETECKAVQRESEKEQASLEMQLTSAEVSIQEAQNKWLFSSPERALFYALTNLAQDSKARDRFLIQFSQSSKQSISDIQREYIELAAKAAPSLYPEFAAKKQIFLAPEITLFSSDPREDYQPIYSKGWQRNYVGETVSSPEENPNKKEVVLMITDTPMALDGLSEKQLDKIIDESGTPLSSDQIKQIIEALSSTLNPLAEYQRYPQTVQDGEFKGFHVLKRGRQGRVLFKYRNGKVCIRFGDYYRVYADGKKWKG